MDESKAREILQKLIDGCGRAIRDAERLARDQPDAPPIDVEWFRGMRAKARACLQALDAGGDRSEIARPVSPDPIRTAGYFPCRTDRPLGDSSRFDIRRQWHVNGRHQFRSGQRGGESDRFALACFARFDESG